MKPAKKIVYLDGGLASQMSAYAFFRYLSYKGLKPEMDFVWYKRLGRDQYKLKEIFNIDVPEYRGSFKYDVFMSGGLAARFLRKTGLLSRLIDIGLFPRLYYTIDPPWGGIRFDIDSLPKEAFDEHKETYFWGYWSMGNFLYEIEDELLHQFSFSPLSEIENIKIAEDISIHNSVSIHVRRGDYLKYKEIFSEVTLAYYEKAIEYIKEKIVNPKFFIFSDDIDWCKEEFPKLGLTESNVVYVTWNSGDKSYRDMQLMSLCKHNIVTNSGFSVWAAFLNKNQSKIMIKPQEYFTKEWNNKNGDSFNSFYKNRWVEIKNSLAVNSQDRI